MLKANLFLAFLLVSPKLVAAEESQHPLETVPEIEINQYMGDWHQVATIPAFFQRKCVKNTMASYKLNGDKIQVINSCTKDDGETQTASGQARVNKKYGINTKLQVTFLKIFTKWIWLFAGDYWIIDLAKDYSHSIVGSPSRDYLWILSRTKTISKESFSSHKATIESKGYDTCKVIVTQDGELYGQKLCDIE